MTPTFILFIAAVATLGVATVMLAAARLTGLALVTLYALFVVGPDMFAVLVGALAAVNLAAVELLEREGWP